jgi:hypothetical protein
MRIFNLILCNRHRFKIWLRHISWTGNAEKKENHEHKNKQYEDSEPFSIVQLFPITFKRHNTMFYNPIISIKQALLIIIFCGLSWTCYAETIILDSKAEFDAYLSSSTDLITSDSGLMFRSEDKPNDFIQYPQYETPITHELVTDDVPIGSGFATSRHLNAHYSTKNWTGMKLVFGKYAAEMQPTQLDIWLKTPYHLYDGSVFAEYVYNMGAGRSLQCSPIYTQGIFAIANDVHDFACGFDYVFSSNNNSDPTKFGYTTRQGLTSQTWRKISIPLDWTNKKYGYKINDTTVSTWYSGSGCAATTPTFSASWLNFMDQGYWAPLTGAGGANVDIPRTHIDMWQELYDYSITQLDDDHEEMDYYICTSFCKYFLHTASAVFALQPSSGTTNSLTITWTQNNETDENVTALYSRSFLDDTATITASSELTGYEASKVITEDGTSKWLTATDALPTAQTLRITLASPKKLTKANIYAAGLTRTISTIYHSGDLSTTSVTTTENHGYEVNDIVEISGITTDARFNGTYKIVTINSATQFTYSQIVVGFTNTTVNSEGSCENYTKALIKAYKIRGSNDNNSAWDSKAWTDLKDTDWITDGGGRGQDVTWENGTAYIYYDVQISSNNTGGASNQVGLKGLRLRETATSTASDWTGASMQYRVSTNGGSSYGSWRNALSGVAFPIASTEADNLRVQVKPTLTTDLQKYHPVVPTLAVEFSDESVPDIIYPTVTILTSDPQNVSIDSVSITWTDDDDVGVTSRKWRIGSAPDATHGTEATSPATVTGLSIGSNQVYIGAGDAAGNWGSDGITVNYTPSAAGASVTLEGAASIQGAATLQ